MKKILFMISSMNIGGVEKSLLSLISIIPRDKYNITILMLEKKGGFLEDIPNWIKIEEVDWYEKIKPMIMQSPQQILKGYFKEKRYFKSITFLVIYFISKYFDNRYLYYKHVFNDIKDHPNSYDVAVSYQGPTDIIDYYIGYKVIAKKKLSWVHFDVSKHQVNKRLYQKIYKEFLKILVVSKGAKEKLTETIPSVAPKATVFMNVISKQLIHEMSKEIVEFDNNYRGIKIITVGRLSREKGQDMAIKVLHKLRKNGYEVRWYCIGEGKERAEYERLIKDYNLQEDFILLGSRVNPYPYIARSNIYVQPSRHEGYCLTLAEAKCLNKPIITTNFTGAYEQIVDGYNGVIVEFDEQRLYDEIKRLLNNPKKREELSTALSTANTHTENDANKILDYIN